MNAIAIVACLVLGCIAISEAQSDYGRTRPIRPIGPITGIRYCVDYLGYPIDQGNSYCDGRNTCVCFNGMPTNCYRSNCQFARGGNIRQY